MNIHYVSQKNAMFLSTNICEFTKNITPVVPLLQKCNFFEPVPVKSLKYKATYQWFLCVTFVFADEEATSEMLMWMCRCLLQ